jgi:MOSC domain-containing protein YiiM
MSMQQGIVREVLRGIAAPLGHTLSAINKRPVDGPVRLHSLGLEGDEQADLRIHGGVDKALHCYAWDHYDQWRRDLPDCTALNASGAFGENLSVDGLDEKSVCIGDRWSVGSAVVVVTQGRQPCFKLNLRFDVADMAVRVQNTLRAGWYLRVEQPGQVQAGDLLMLLERPHAAFSVAHLLALIRDRATDSAQLDRVLHLPLPPSWRRMFEQRLQSGQVEDWSSRLAGRR